MLRRIRDRFDAQEDEQVYEVYKKVDTLKYNALTRVVELHYRVGKVPTPAFMRIENINDVRFVDTQKVFWFMGSGRGFDIDFMPPAKIVEVKSGSIYVKSK